MLSTKNESCKDVETTSDFVSRMPCPSAIDQSLSPSSLPNQAAAFGDSAYDKQHSNAVADGPPLSAMPDKEGYRDGKARLRRASEGSRLSRGEKSGNELKCEKCGKGYKHSSCLTKHLWEHTPGWAYTSKLLISKHQQVQLLEAASVLVAMNQDDVPSKPCETNETPLDAIGSSDKSSASPAPSSFSCFHEAITSTPTSTTPPRQIDIPATLSQAQLRTRSSSAQASSYLAPPSPFSENVPHHLKRHSSSSCTTTITSNDINRTTMESLHDEEHAQLAAAVGLLSCSYGTPKKESLGLLGDVPPVPPLPPQYSGRREVGAGEVDVNMVEGCEVEAATYDEEGVFGRMEE